MESATACTVLDPEVGPSKEVARLAQRPPTLNGARVGLLWNNRAGGERLLAGIESRLRDKYGIGDVRRHTKHYIGEPASETALADLTANCDFVVTALGD